MADPLSIDRPESLTLALTSNLAEKARAIEQVERFGAAQGWSKGIINEIALILEEWLTNVFGYGFPSGVSGKLELRLDLVSGSIVLQVKDSGTAFNPLTRPDPDLTIPLEQRPIGGLGILLIKNLVDEFSYARRDDCNVVTFKKSAIRPKLRQT